MDNTQRFSNRVENYVKYRPHYPPAIVNYIQQQFGFKTGTIADVGAGTGILTSLFLDAGYAVYAVEPNAPMLAKATTLLQDYPGFTAVPGTAENTTLPENSVDAIMAGQAFHWFNPENSKAEFTRILKPQGLVMLVWNERNTQAPFEQEYDALINKYGKDYVQVKHRNIEPADIESFFAPAPMELKVFDNQQVFDFDGLKGRLLSSSYMPLQGEAGYEEMLTALNKLFDKYQQAGTITITYDTRLYAGKWFN
ncbi:methyltransferase type 11 [Niastella yeongjuensis]|uniref:Methyltransferase type 11 n=1 Tax=Niastella yeongjuensis TaxID=354355 RepID=A0A1V9EPI2_9BACT|nr:class I SAM-dependent methyltransferase [Niastella yeongjuensis]OQP48037.1 methyltransferase type 11 [Niastella yeongjuensis]SEO24386.1 Methyltransferase domain-containing protein [Niastella yeongjuensis]